MERGAARRGRHGRPSYGGGFPSDGRARLARAPKPHFIGEAKDGGECCHICLEPHGVRVTQVQPPMPQHVRASRCLFA